MVQVRVTSTNRRKVRQSWFHLRRAGLRRDRFGAYTGDLATRRQVERLRDYCGRKHLGFRINNAYGKRGNSYRSLFFRTHAPAFGHYYFCAYCGKLLPEKKVTVDHLYPVGCASRDLKMQKKLKRYHLKGINDPDNLVAACRECNQRKGRNMGRWIRRGKLGRHAWYWELRWAFRLAAVAGIVFLAVWLCLHTGVFREWTAAIR